MVRGSIRHPHARALAEADVRWERMHLLFERQRIFGVSARDGLRGVYAVAFLYLLHPVTDSLNHARAIRSWRVGKRGLLRVGAGAHVRVVGIHARRVNTHQHLSGARLGRRRFFEFENFGPPELTNENGFHDLSPTNATAPRKLPGARLRRNHGREKREPRTG